jgi:hypothetical protein
VATTEDDPINDKPMPLLDHLVELRTRLIWSMVAFAICFAVSYYFSNRIYYFLARPLAQILRDSGTPDPKLIYTQLYEAFFTRIKLAFFGGAFLGFPMIACQLWLFVAPGCIAARSARCCRFWLATPVLFLLGAALAYFFVFPVRVAVLRQLPEQPAAVHHPQLRRAHPAVVRRQPQHHACEIRPDHFLLQALRLHQIGLGLRRQPQIDLPLRHDPARNDRVDPDFVGRPDRGPCLWSAPRRRLSRSCRRACRRVGVPGDRAEIDDRSAAGARIIGATAWMAKNWCRRLVAMAFVPELDRDVFPVVPLIVGGVVHQHGDRPEFFGRGVDRARSAPMSVRSQC